VTGFYHKKIRQNQALKNKKNACGHRKQNGIFQQKHNIFFKKQALQPVH